MKRLLSAFNELPKPPFVDKLPPLTQIKALGPEIPQLVLQIIRDVLTNPLVKDKAQWVKPHLVSVTALVVEKLFNQHIYQQKALVPYTQRLANRSLALAIRELAIEMTFVFSESKMDVLVDSEFKADCRLETSLATLKKLKDKQLISQLIQSNELSVEGDMTVLQDLNQLIDKMEPGIGAVLSPIIGDLAASVVESVMHQLFKVSLVPLSYFNSRQNMGTEQ